MQDNTNVILYFMATRSSYKVTVIMGRERETHNEKRKNVYFLQRRFYIEYKLNYKAI